MAGRRRCAIHQPNFLPRLSTLAKIYAADVWVVLDDVQFCRRDYQHRARLGQLTDPTRQQWLSLSVELPRGRATRINEVRLVDQARCQRRLEGLTAQYFARSRHWGQLRGPITELARLVGKTGRLDEVAEASTCQLLELLGWRGEVVRSSALTVRPGRSERLADLVAAVGATTYLCGTGGARYLDEQAFRALGLDVQYAAKPAWVADQVWQDGRNVCALWAMMTSESVVRRLSQSQR